MPLDIFPDMIADFIRSVAKAVGASEGYVVATFLAMAAGAIGNARVGRVGPEWAVPSILWFLLIGDPAAAKSPAMGRTLKPYRTLEAEEQAAHAAAGLPDLEDDAHAWRQAVMPDGGENIQAALGPKPLLMCEMMTYAGLIEMLAQHRRGMLMTADEIAGFVKTMPSDLRALLLKCADGAPFRRYTAKENTDLAGVLLSIVGSIQPDVLEKHVPKLASDGLFARFCPVWGVPESVVDLNARIDDGPILDVLRGLRALQMDEGMHGPAPQEVPFTDDARALMAARITAARQSQGQGLLMRFIGKSDGTVARLALVLALMRVVSTGPDTPETVEADDVRAAGRLFDDYLLPMARSVYWRNGCSETELAAYKLVKKLQANRVTSIPVRELQRMAPEKFKKGDAFLDLMTWLQRAHVVRLMKAAPSGPRGGAPSRRAAISPRIWPSGQAPQPE
ncbi:DUF3987 domain-containing protein [Loktanella sp. TSTF-M6]|uniref:DUF3987 domain-containing protein n=1 Tax=Loktanella gaetbuli TaxID=2881335 RepID=A0ABS8BXS0_9RHOB|nr:DUF3987 domain-containing protein [Loktanella gaetbuli]MCB5200523.1 DUF3987 domain-containing protein [Loktanella gaetbuli]